MIDDLYYMLMIREAVSNLSFEEKIAEWKRLQGILPGMIQACIDAHLKGKWHCEHCNTYFDMKTVAGVSRKEVDKGVCVFSDYGYGDWDEFADVEYLKTYKICPKCGAETAFQKMYVGESNRRGR